MATLSVQAPEGSHFEFEEVKSSHGTKSLGERPLLVWNDLDAMRSYYGDEGVLRMADGTSLRVSFQSIGRRMALAGKSDDEIAQAQVDFRPGERRVGESTPASRAARAAKSAADKVDGDKITALLQRIAAGEISEEDLEALV